jgi:hypothetical protein
MTGNEVPMPSPAALQAAGPAAAPAPAPATSAAAALAASAAALASAAGAPAPSIASTGSGAANSAIACPGDYCGNFQVHHFDGGTIFGGFAFSTISTKSFSVGTVPCGSFPSGSTAYTACGGATATSPAAAYAIQGSSSRVGTAVIAGVEIYLHPQDMYPHMKSTNYGAGILVGASVYPLNQYYVGLSVEPVHGFTLGAGFVAGSQQKLPSGYGVGTYLGNNATGSATPTISTSSSFHGGAFLMLGFDINIFQTFFSSVTSIGTSLSALKTN